jgi:hypothetical protein
VSTRTLIADPLALLRFDTLMRRSAQANGALREPTERRATVAGDRRGRTYDRYLGKLLNHDGAGLNTAETSFSVGYSFS